MPCRSVSDDPVSFDTYWEQRGTDTNVNLTTVKTRLATFINTTAAGASAAMKAYLGQQIDNGTNVASISIYDITAHLDGSPAGGPIDVSNFTANVPEVLQPLPQGVAAVISYRADYGSDVEFGAGSRPRARDRNRFYLGPLNVNAITTESATGRCRLDVQFMTDITHAVSTLMSITESAGDTTTMVVWSRKNAGVKGITHGWVDQRPGYQRRRSDPSGIRSVWTPAT